MFAEVARYRDFILAPLPSGRRSRPAVAISGTPRAGRRLTCTSPGWDTPPDRVQFCMGPLRGQATVGRRATYRVRGRDRGSLLICVAAARNAGGITTAPLAETLAVFVR